MDLWNSFGGMIMAEMTCAEPAIALQEFEKAGMALSEICYRDDLTITFRIQRKYWHPLYDLCGRKGYRLRVIRYTGLHWVGKRLIKRPLLLVGLTLMAAMTMYLQTRVLFIHVEGNETIPTRHILQQAAQCGVAFGTSARSVRSEKVKNALLETMPELQWAGINTRGCVATIIVRERPIPDRLGKDNAVSSIVAARDGIIQEITVTKGSPACRVGQAVQAGQVLISAYTDCGLTIQACRADGEVLGLTRHELQISAPSDYLQREPNGVREEKFALILGKKRINFYNGSGISDSRCVKMYSEKYVTLPGGFVLPIAIVTESTIDTECASVTLPISEAELSSFAGKYLQSTMRSGRILRRHESFTAEDGYVTMGGIYQCTEMIGIRKQEEIIKPND
jgi:similar to stage IV sporulation protein